MFFCLTHSLHLIKKNEDGGILLKVVSGKMATTLEQSKQEAAMEGYQEATAMMWKMAEGNPLINALMREDQDEVDRLTEQTMLEVREEVEEIMGEMNLDSRECIQRDIEVLRGKMDAGEIDLKTAEAEADTLKERMNRLSA